MPNRDTDRTHSRAGALAFAVLFSFAGLGQPAAQTQHPLAGSFDELFANPVKVAPLFTRPEVTSRLPALPVEPGDDVPATTASTSPPETAPPQGEDKTGVVNALKKLIVPPAEAETAPPPPATAQAAEPQDTAALATPRQPQAARASRLGRTMPRLQAARIADLKRTGWRIARGSLQAAGPAKVSRLGPVGGGRAVWYQHAGRTASGERFNPDGLTAAHKTLPLGTRVRVVNKRNGRSVVVRINDRVPAKVNAAIDLSRGSARALGIADVGSVALYKVR